MADGEVVPEENVTLKVRAAEMGGGVKAPPDEIYGAPNFDVFDTPQSRTIVILELMVIAYSDDEYHEDERPIIDDFIKKFGFTDDEVARFEKWAMRQSPLSVEGWDFISKSGSVDG